MPNVLISRTEAKAAGLKRYATGLPCRRGHVAERHVSDFQCVECKSLKRDPVWVDAWRERNKERLAAQRKDYRERNAADIASRKREKYLATREAVLADRKTYYAANQSKILTRMVNYRLRKLDELRAKDRRYYANNSLKRRADGHAQRAKRAQAAGSYTAEDIKRILIAQRKRCAACKILLRSKYHADHIVPIARGGSNYPSNIQILCAPCNRRKSARDPIMFMQSQGFLL